MLKRWAGAKWVLVRKYWHLWKRNHHYRRIGVHRYRKRVLRRFWHTKWTKVRSYWHLWRKNHYYKRPRWFWGRNRRIGRHRYRFRTYRKWTGAKWGKVRSYWHLYRRNHYNHRLHGKTKWTWGGYKRIGVHRYRQRKLYRNVQGKWKFVRQYWHL